MKGRVAPTAGKVILSGLKLVPKWSVERGKCSNCKESDSFLNQLERKAAPTAGEVIVSQTQTGTDVVSGIEKLVQLQGK